MQKTNRKTAFTLTELMIVVGIVAVLATAIFLSMGDVADTAEVNVILANLQSLRSASSVSFAGGDEEYREQYLKPYWRNSHENTRDYKPLVFPDDGGNERRAQDNANLIDLPIAKYAEDWNFANIVPAHGKDPNSGNNKNYYFIGIKAGGITVKTAELAIASKGVIWATIDQSYYVGKPYSTPGQNIGHQGGPVFSDKNSPSRQAWESNVVNNPYNLSRLVFFYRIPIDGD